MGLYNGQETGMNKDNLKRMYSLRMFNFVMYTIHKFYVVRIVLYHSLLTMPYTDNMIRSSSN